MKKHPFLSIVCLPLLLLITGASCSNSSEESPIEVDEFAAALTKALRFEMDEGERIVIQKNTYALPSSNIYYDDPTSTLINSTTTMTIVTKNGEDVYHEILVSSTMPYNSTSYTHELLRYDSEMQTVWWEEMNTIREKQFASDEEKMEDYATRHSSSSIVSALYLKFGREGLPRPRVLELKSTKTGYRIAFNSEITYTMALEIDEQGRFLRGQGKYPGSVGYRHDEKYTMSYWDRGKVNPTFAHRFEQWTEEEKNDPFLSADTLSLVDFKSMLSSALQQEIQSASEGSMMRATRNHNGSSRNPSESHFYEDDEWIYAVYQDPYKFEQFCRIRKDGKRAGFYYGFPSQGSLTVLEEKDFEGTDTEEFLQFYAMNASSYITPCSVALNLYYGTLLPANAPYSVKIIDRSVKVFTQIDRQHHNYLFEFDENGRIVKHVIEEETFGIFTETVTKTYAISFSDRQEPSEETKSLFAEAERKKR